MNKFFITAAAAVSISFSSFAQTTEGAMEDFSEYIKLTEEENWSGVIGYMPDVFVDQIGREMLLGVLEQAIVQIEQSGLSLDDFTDFTASDKFLDYEGSKYTLLEFTTHMSFRGPQDQMEQMQSMAATALNATAAEIKEDEEGSRVLHLEVPSTVLAVAVQGTEDWRFMRYTDQQKPMVAQLISQELVDRLEELK
ncbi:MAG: hypothetical protein HWD92_13125 [Flavobacteriia bacterium]|nr:hypothetical protein [Flavobacteriia bacterium]